MKDPACVGGQEKDRRAADGGIFISTLLEFVLYKDRGIARIPLLGVHISV